MKKGYTHIAVLLDRSGSMSGIRDEVIGGFNSFLKEQRETEGTATMSISQFDNIYDVIEEFAPIDAVKDLTEEVFVPRGLTALNDSLAKLIDSVGKRLAALTEEERPEKVLFHIITDGYENCSIDRDGSTLRAKVKHQEDKYGWCFVYIGANQDSHAEAFNKGISNALNYEANSRGVSDMLSNISSMTASYRTSKSLDTTNFTSLNSHE